MMLAQTFPLLNVLAMACKLVPSLWHVASSRLQTDSQMLVFKSLASTKQPFAGKFTHACLSHCFEVLVHIPSHSFPCTLEQDEDAEPEEEDSGSDSEDVGSLSDTLDMWPC